MDFEEERLSVITILFLTGLCCLGFTGVIYLLDGHIMPLFLRAGLISLGTAAALFCLRQLVLLSKTRRQTRKTS